MTSLPKISNTQGKFQILLLDQFTPPSEGLDPEVRVFTDKMTENLHDNKTLPMFEDLRTRLEKNPYDSMQTYWVCGDFDFIFLF